MYIVSILMIIFLLLALKFFLRIPVAFGNINLVSVVVYRDFGVLTALALAFWITSPLTNQHYVMGQIPLDILRIALYSSFAFMVMFIFYGFFFKQVFRNLAFKMPKANENLFVDLMKIWLSLIIILIVIMYFSNPPVLMKLFDGATALDISIARSEVGGNSLFQLLRNSWVPLTSYTCLYLFLNNKIKKNWLVLSIICAVICALWSGAKSTLASLMLGYLGVYIISKKNLKLSNLKIIFFAIIFIAFILLMYYLTTLHSDTTFENIITTAKFRFFGQAAGVGYSFYMYPTFFEHKYFTGVSTYLANISGNQFSSVYGDLIDYAVPEFADISGAMSSFAAGDAYGLFGWWGILIGPAFAAFFYFLFYYLTVAGNARILFIGMYGLYFGNAYLASSFYSFVWPVGMILTISPMLVFYILSALNYDKK